MRFFRPVLAAAALFVLAACSDPTSPADRALDGLWTTGHSIVGLEGGFTLSWSRHSVHGTGDYNLLSNQAAACAGAPVNTLGGATLDATRTSSTALSGTVTFDGGVQAQVDGTFNSSGIIDLTITSPSGASCDVGLIHGDPPAP